MNYSILYERPLFVPNISATFLSLQMAYLYSLFKNQVDEFCEFSEMENCINELTKYGLKKLREMPENKLDEMDPYQRGASAISKCC